MQYSCHRTSAERITITALPFVLFLLAAVFGIFGCKPEPTASLDAPPIMDYRDIPGITAEEIEAIEALKEQRISFSYGMMPSIEAFVGADGEVKGFAALFCEWLSELFGVPFVLRLDAWNDIVSGLADGSLDFTGDLTPNEERRKTYLMTDPIAKRTIIYLRLKNSASLLEVARTRLPRYALLEGGTTINDVLAYATERFEVVYVSEYTDAYELLKTGVVDALVTENTSEYAFTQDDIAVSDFLPLIYSPVSLTAQNPELAPIITAVQKALNSSGARYLSELYRQSERDYVRHKLLAQFTEEELAYIKDNPVIFFGAEYDNYPVSFFDIRYNKWQGISFDVLSEVSVLTGLEFTVKNEPNMGFPELLLMLEAKEVPMLSEVLRSREREARFLWPNSMYATDYPTLISKTSHHDITLNEIYSVKVGLAKSTASAEWFRKWFPDHDNIVDYENLDAVYGALVRGEVSMVMHRVNGLLRLTHYQELPGYKANIVFNNAFEATFGFNTDEAVLRSIVDKALELINTKAISDRWVRKTYDYRVQLAQAQAPWIISAAIALAMILALLTVVYIKGRKKTKFIAEQAEALKGALHESNETLNLLEYNRQMMDAVNKTSALFLSQHEKSFEDMMTQGVGIIVDLLDVDRISVWRNNKKPDGLCASQIYRWDRQEGGTVAPAAEFVDISYSSFSPHLEELLASGSQANGPVNLMPDADLFVTFGIVSVFITPIFIKDDFWGAVFYEDRVNEREFDHISAEMMRSAAFLFANSVIRAEMESNIAKAGKRTQLMLDSIPVSCCLIDRNMEFIDCNEAALKLARIDDKQTFFDNHFNLFPKYQADGRNSIEIMMRHVNRAFDEGKSVFEFTYQLLSGMPVPVHITLVRVNYENKNALLCSIQDLREQKRMTARIEAIMNNLPGMAFQEIYDPPEYTYAFVSQGCEELTGYTAKELIGCGSVNFLKMTRPDDADYAEKLAVDRFSTKQPFETTYQITMRNGTKKWIWESSRVTERNPDGSPCLIEGYSMDITERKKLEEVEREQKAMALRIEAMIDNLPGMVFQQLFNPPEYTYLFASRGCKELTGYTVEELVGNGSVEILKVANDEAENISMAAVEALTKGMPFETTYKIVTRDGTVKWIWESCRVTERNPDGTPRLIEGYNMDITERKKLEEAERKHKQMALRIETIMSNLPGMAYQCMYDMPNYTITFASRGCKELTGYTPEELVGGANKYMAMVHPNDVENIDYVSGKTLALGLTYENTYRIVMRDGTIKWVWERSHAVERNPDGTPYLIDGYVFDVTERWKLETAEMANRAKSDFLAVMSHEIRTPMNSIMGFAELAMNIAASPQIKDYLGKITDSTKWLLNIINDILDISKIESGKLELEQVPFDLREIVSRCQSVVLPNIKNKGLELRVYAEPIAGKRLIGDPVRLYQILLNLLSNAIKFTDIGTIKLTATIKGVGSGNAEIYFEVSDTGIGMNSEQVKKIFDPFIQADSSTTRKYGGTGLGLTIVKNIVEMMGGELAIDSSPGSGTAFSFEITFETIDVFGDAAEYVKFDTLDKPQFDGLVLVCDDNIMNQQVMHEHLTNVGLKAVMADNGKIGVEKVRKRMQNGEKPFDLILMDIFMPVMDGIEAASKITKLNTGTPIVAVTANVMVSEIEKYKKHGMPDYLGKPFTSQELWRILLRYLTLISSSAENGNGKTQDKLQKTLRINFAKYNQSKYNEITEAIAANDTKLAHRLAHSLKGNAGFIGKTALQKIAGEIESLLRDKMPVPESSMNVLRIELTEALEELKPLLEETKAIKILSVEEIEILFEKLEPMLKNINPECMNLLDEIRAVPGAEELADQIENFEFELAIKTLVELREKEKKGV